MRVETPENAQVRRARMPYKSLLEAVQASNRNMPAEPEIKRAPIKQDLPPLTEATRQATVERERKDGKLRGVESGETYEQALQRFAKEDGKTYSRSFEEEDELAKQRQMEQEVDDDLYARFPEMRNIIDEERGRTPQSVQEPDQVISYDDMINIDAIPNRFVGEQDSPDVVTQETPAIADMSRPAAEAVKKIDQSAIKDRFKNFAAGFQKQAEKNAKNTPVPQQSAAETANMIRANSGAAITPQENALGSLQEQAKRYLMRR